MTASLHWFRFYPKDWLSSPSVSRMLPEQRGAYMQLLGLAWRDGSEEPWLPNDPFALAQLSGLGGRWKKLGALVLAQFEVRGERLYNEKLSEVWREGQDQHRLAAEKGRKGGLASAAKKKRQSGGPATGTPSSPAKKEAPPQKQSPANPAASTQVVAGVKQSGSGTTVEPALTSRVLPVVAPSGALAPEMARAPGAPGNDNGARDVSSRNGDGPAPSRSTQLARRAADDAVHAQHRHVVDAWCAEHPVDAATLRAQLAKEFRGEDAIVVNARELAFNAHVLKRLESVHA